MTGPDPFEELDRELDAWLSAGLTATLWWRDDDAGEMSSGLDRLIALSERHGVVCGLATVPAWVADALAERLKGATSIEVLQHGYAHVNHAPRGQGLGAWELGLHRPLEIVMAELTNGREMLSAKITGAVLPVVAAPWNHIDPALFEPMVEAGFVGVSAADARPTPCPVPGLLQVNGHCDPIKWKGGACFRGAEKSVRDMVEHLTARRVGEVDRTEPTGLLTHHRDTDGACWRFLDALMARTRAHGAAQWLAPSEIWT